MQQIRIVHWGLGAMGSGIAKLANEKSGLSSVGAFDRDVRKLGRDLGEVLGLSRTLGVTIGESPQEKFSVTDADLVIVATGSFTREVFKQIELAVNSGVNVITIAEEMAYPGAGEPQLAVELDRLAKLNGVTILGTGINPGFVLDSLVIAMTGPCLEVTKIKASRINDLSPFGPTVMATQGVGTTPEEFNAGLKDGTIVGHVGFPESISLIARALGWDIDEIIQTREPIISKVRRQTDYVVVEPGNVAGCRHTAQGLSGGKVVIELIHPQQVLPDLEGVETGDYIEIAGEPNINLKIQPEIPGGLGTMAMAVNMIPQVMTARAGLLSMADLPLPAAIMGDVRNLIAMRKGER
jgi:2,4-diaminopentanoate dehydrogenase